MGPCRHKVWASQTRRWYMSREMAAAAQPKGLEDNTHEACVVLAKGCEPIRPAESAPWHTLMCQTEWPQW